MRLERIENLADAAYAVFAQMGSEARQKFASLVDLLRVYAKPSIEEGTDQPGPDSALVVRRVACAQVAEVLRFEIGMILVQGSEAVTRQQAIGDEIDD